MESVEMVAPEGNLCWSGTELCWWGWIGGVWCQKDKQRVSLIVMWRESLSPDSGLCHFFQKPHFFFWMWQGSPISKWPHCNNLLKLLLGRPWLFALGLKAYHPVHHPGAPGQWQTCCRPGLKLDSHSWRFVLAPCLWIGNTTPPAQTHSQFWAPLGRWLFYFYQGEAPISLVVFKPLSEKMAYFSAVRGGSFWSGEEEYVTATVNICLYQVSSKTARDQAVSQRWWPGRALDSTWSICSPLPNVAECTAVSQPFVDNDVQKASEICSPADRAEAWPMISNNGGPTGLLGPP